MNRHLATIPLALSLAVPLGALPAAAQDEAPPPKREEGRYFIDLAEIFIDTSDFDLAIASVDPGGPGDSQPAHEVAAEIPSYGLEAPRLTFGLNRPNGKTTYLISYHDFELSDERIPPDFDDQSNVVNPYLVPAGVVYRRQVSLPTGSLGATPYYTPNWATDIAYQRDVAVRLADVAVEHNVFENKSFRLRWVGGLRYAQLQQNLNHAVAFAKEAQAAAPSSTRTRDVQDFHYLQSRIDTVGLGPRVGLSFRALAGERRRWSFEGRGDVSYLPETTTARYAIRMADSPLVPRIVYFNPTTNEIRISANPASPIIPGLAFDPLLFSFAAENQQDDFGEGTWQAQGELGVRFKATSFFSVGLNLWHLRWMNVLSQTDMLADALNEATYEAFRGNPEAGDPQLRTDSFAIHLPRYSGRETFAFSGLGLTLNFEF